MQGTAAAHLHLEVLLAGGADRVRPALGDHGGPLLGQRRTLGRVCTRQENLPNTTQGTLVNLVQRCTANHAGLLRCAAPMTLGARLFLKRSQFRGAQALLAQCALFTLRLAPEGKHVNRGEQSARARHARRDTPERMGRCLSMHRRSQHEDRGTHHALRRHSTWRGKTRCPKFAACSIQLKTRALRNRDIKKRAWQFGWDA